MYVRFVKSLFIQLYLFIQKYTDSENSTIILFEKNTSIEKERQ